MFRIPQPATQLPAPMAVVIMDDHHTQRFSSRREALAYALRECRAAVRRGESNTVIDIQGADGQWRSFDSRLMPVHAVTESSSPPDPSSNRNRLEGQKTSSRNRP